MKRLLLLVLVSQALVMVSLEKLLSFERNLVVEAGPMVVVGRQKDTDGKFEWYGILNHTGQLGNAFFEPVPLLNTKLQFKPQKPVASVRSLQSDQSIEILKNICL